MLEAPIQLLPPVTFVGPSATVGPTPARSRALLAVLALQPNRVVTQAKLAEILWDRPPDSAKANIRTLVANLRAQVRRAGLDDRIRIVTHRAAWGGEGGYRIETDPSLVDLLTLDEHTRAVRARCTECPAAALQQCHALLEINLEGFGVDFHTTQWFEATRVSLLNTRMLLEKMSISLRIVLGDFQHARDEARSRLAERDDPQLSALAIAANFLAGDTLESLDGIRRESAHYQSYGVDLPRLLRRVQLSILNEDRASVVAEVQRALGRV
ncbi:AfsR/SARP family transcriptional regulator [Glycomyces tarimensis]